MFRKLKTIFQHKKGSSVQAKKRLQLLLIHDKIELTPREMVNMKQEIVDVIARYLNVDQNQTHFRLDRMDSQIKLVSSIAVSSNAKHSVEG
jgi:cell division topological specificity factor